MRGLAASLLALLVASAPPSFAMSHLGVANPNLTEMDAFAAPSLFAWYGAKNVFSGNIGKPLYNVRRQTDGATEDVYPTYTGWPSIPALTAWSQGSQLFVDEVYDQSGQGNNCLLPTASTQPTINLLGSKPTIHFDGGGQVINCAALDPVTNNVPGLTAVIVRKKDTTDVTTDYSELGISTSASASTAQLTMVMDSAVSNNDICAGRRLTTDGYIRVVSSTSAFPPTTNWEVHTCNANYSSALMSYQSTTTNSVTKNPFSTAGLSPAANALSVTIGSYLGSLPWSGDMTGIGFYQASMSTAFMNGWTTALADLEPAVAPAPLPFMWGNSPRLAQTITTQAPGFTYHLVEQPDGATPAITDLNSFQYRHHTRIAEFGGRIWIANTGNQAPETDQGLQTFIVSSTTHFSATPTVAVAFAQQSAWGDTTADSRGVIPRAFVVYNGSLYLTGQISSATGLGGIVLVAVLCNSDGSIGTPFVIAPSASVSYASYTANPGYAQYVYNATLGPPLFALSNTYGQYEDGTSSDPWRGTLAYGGAQFCERGAVPLDTGGLNIAFVNRVCSGNGGNYSFITETHDGDVTETNPVLSTIPSGGSPVSGVLLPDGEYALVGNTINSRNLQWLATFNATTGAINNLYYTAQCSTFSQYTPSCTPLYPAGGKSGGPSYGSLWVDTDDGLLIGAFSVAKESIYEWEIPLNDL